ncbi:fungal-specific transcription factor domain-containing protein [Dendryphion nanum]|uniref:Fungal-specific transcription factor domain-containing protein n=1 Tax=Dendryphion nanum TaxID=256645 RepID=A0A9P9IPK5_9PLEO|nr:fungal-specific transcription factor domain-containing protein [Dendryphion nanum]
MMSAKVRIACKRCRVKRIKCDGGIPGCGNCQRANQPCVDVDGRDKTVSIPRDFAASARARIEWLEIQIRSLSPEFDLVQGPQVDFSFLEGLASSVQPGPPSPDTQIVAQQAPDSSAALPTIPNKRTYASIADPMNQDSFGEEARSVALHLGLLTLNSDSRQTHYLGTSSGRLFTSLIGADSPDTIPRRSASVTSSVSPGYSGPFAYTKRAKDSCRMLYDSLRKNLPSEEDAHILLQVYFENIHLDHPFMHPSSVMSAVEALYQCAAADVAVEIGYKGWPASMQPFEYNGEYDVSRNTNCTPISIFTASYHVFMVFTLAATVKVRQRTYDFAPNQFYRVAMSSGQQCFSETSIASLQGTLLLAAYSLLTPAEINIWTLIYVAMAHCVDLGLHRTPHSVSTLSRTAIFVRRMIFFSVYHLDRSIAAIQGRPLGIRDETFDLQLPTIEDVQSDISSVEAMKFVLELSVSDCLAFAVHRFKLDPIISQIKLLFYHLPSQASDYVWPSDQQSSLLHIRQKLEDWRHELSAIANTLKVASGEIRLDHHKYELKLTSQFHAIMILLYQPSQTIPHPTEQSLLVCCQSATSRLRTYNELYNIDGFYQSWRSVQGIFSSGATMIYCIWTSDLVRKTFPLVQVMSDLRKCTNLLSVGGEWWPSVKRGKESLDKAMDALPRKYETNQHQDRGHRDHVRPRMPSMRHNHTTAHTRPDESLDTTTTNEIGKDDDRGLHRTFDEEHVDTINFSNTTSGFVTTDWTVLENNEFAHMQEFSDPFIDSTVGPPDSAVEAFIAEFLNNDTAWNPF